MDLRESEVRDGRNDQERIVRMKWNWQYILNTTLKGEHYFLEDNRLKLDWTGVFSKAYSKALGTQFGHGFCRLPEFFLQI